MKTFPYCFTTLISFHKTSNELEPDPNSLFLSHDFIYDWYGRVLGDRERRFILWWYERAAVVSGLITNFLISNTVKYPTVIGPTGDPCCVCPLLYSRTRKLEINSTRPQLQDMRTLLKPLAIHAAYSPIETIVFLSVVGTLAYLHILNQIKHSAFFAPLTPVRSAYALYTHDWLPVREAVWFRDDSVPRLDLQQILFSGPRLETPSLQNVTSHIAAAHPGFTHLQTAPLAWTQTIQVHGDFALRSLPPDSWGVAYELDAPGEAIAQMRSGKWVAYALRHLVVRFYELAKVCGRVHFTVPR